LTNWSEPEWGFPKGRRNYQENDISCALREFEEETGYSRKEVNIINNLKPFQEIFTGSNYKSYKHKYFLGFIPEPIEHTNFQKSEVSQMKWLNLKDCLKKIRPYNLERIELINNINSVLHKYSLIS
jgi:8-oxo-dGTP pyrophosphatase MutT (NUDIX family)